MKNTSTAFLALLFAAGLTACTSASKSDENVGDGTDLLASTDIPAATDTAQPLAEMAPPIDAPIQEAQQDIQQKADETVQNLAPPIQEPVLEEKAPAQTAAAPTPRTGEHTATGTYRVQKGDTLMKIAYEKYGDLYQWRKILELNSDVVSNLNGLTEGTVLKLDSSYFVDNHERNGERYLIKHGDTLGSISDDVYGTQKKWRKIWENNKPLIKDPNRIYAGFFLYYLMNETDKIELTKYREEKGTEDSPREPASK